MQDSTDNRLALFPAAGDPATENVATDEITDAFERGLRCQVRDLLASVDGDRTSQSRGDDTPAGLLVAALDRAYEAGRASLELDPYERQHERELRELELRIQRRFPVERAHIKRQDEKLAAYRQVIERLLMHAPLDEVAAIEADLAAGPQCTLSLVANRRVTEAERRAEGSHRAAIRCAELLDEERDKRHRLEGLMRTMMDEVGDTKVTP